MFILVAALILTFIVLFYKYVEHKQTYWKRLRVTSPTPAFFFGSYGDNMSGKRNNIEIYDELYKNFKNTDRVVGIYQMLKPELLVVDPALAKEILVKNFSSFHDTSFGKLLHLESDPLLARNPFFLCGQAWKDKRSEITPAFSPARIKAMFPLIDEICDRITKHLTTKQNEAIEARDLCSRFTCDVVSNCIFAADAESFQHKNPKVWTMAKQIFGGGEVVGQIKFLITAIAPGLAQLLKFRFVPTETQDFFCDLMTQAVKQRQGLGNVRQDYLEYLLQMQGKKNVSELELAANAITFFIDGFETSAAAIACVLFELAQHKDIQSRLREELKDVTSYDQIIEHEYLDMVFSEALRIHPPGGILIRECTNTFELDLLNKGRKLKINKGVTVFIPTWSIHHDETIYEEPEQFNPERFAAGALKQFKDDGVYLTFGNGPRTCIGQKFAITQAKACIKTVLKEFEIDVDNQTKLPLKLIPKDFITYYSGGLWLRFNKISV